MSVEDRRRRMPPGRGRGRSRPWGRRGLTARARAARRAGWGHVRVRAAPSRSAARGGIGRTKRPRRVQGHRPRHARGQRPRPPQAQRPEGDVGPHLGHRAPAGAGAAEHDARPEGHGERRAPDRGAVAGGAARARRGPDDPHVRAALAQDALGDAQPGVRATRRSARGAGRGRSGRCSSRRRGVAVPAQGGPLPRQPVGGAGEAQPAEGLEQVGGRRHRRDRARRRSARWRPGRRGRPPGRSTGSSTPPPSSTPGPAGAGRGERDTTSTSAPGPDHDAVAGGRAAARVGGRGAGRATGGRTTSGVTAGSGDQIGPAEERRGHVDVDVGQGRAGEGHRRHGGQDERGASHGSPGVRGAPGHGARCVCAPHYGGRGGSDHPVPRRPPAPLGSAADGPHAEVRRRPPRRPSPRSPPTGSRSSSPGSCSAPSGAR